MIRHTDQQYPSAPDQKCIELEGDYCETALGRFSRDVIEAAKPVLDPDDPSNYYRVPRPRILWTCDTGEALPEDGGKKRSLKSGKAKDNNSPTADISS